MATPILDSRILKLRRKLGDLYDADGNEYVAEPAGGTGKIYVGSASAIKSTWTSAELLDIFNDSIHQFLDYCFKFVPTEKFGLYIPGYIRAGRRALTAVTSVLDGNYHYLDFNGATPNIMYLISMKCIRTAKPYGKQHGIEIPPDQFLEKFGEFNSSYAGQLMWSTLIHIDGEGISVVNALNTAVDVVYIKKHVNLVHNSATDIAGITEQGLMRIQTLAEVLAQRYRSQEVKDLPDIEKKEIIESDITLRGR